MPTSNLEFADTEVSARLNGWMLHEAGLLDERRLAQWLDLVAEDFRYEIPVPVTRDNPELVPYAAGTYLVEETRESIESLWLARWEPEFFEWSWGENPPQRIRRFVTNIRAYRGEEAGSYEVKSNVLLSFARQSDPAILVPAGRIDQVREAAEGEFELGRRVVILDEPVVRLTHMRIIF